MTKQTIHDITLPLSESLVVWTGHPNFTITHRTHLSRGDHATVSNLFFSAHTGTHVDAPSHFIQDAGTIDNLDLNMLIGEAVVVDAGEREVISAEFLEESSIPPGTKRVLFRTNNSKLWSEGKKDFTEEYVGITNTGAEWIVGNGIKLVGTDYLSVASFSENVNAHQTLLQAETILVEGLYLYDIVPGTYQLICLPLKIAGAEGAPARVVLVG